MPKIKAKYFELHVYSPKSSKFLLLKRASHKIYPGIWQMVTGRIEKNESTKEAIHRELREETGLKAEKLFVIPRVETYFTERDDSVNLCPVFLAFTDSDRVKISDEHTEYRWASYDESMQLIHWEDQIVSLRLIKVYLSDKMLFEKLIEIKI